MTAVTMPFGDRPMPVGAPGITSEVLPASGPDEMLILVSLPTFTDPHEWGAQYLLVVREASDGWRLESAFSRRLCIAVAQRGACAGG
jgi:hypothetical protein